MDPQSTTIKALTGIIDLLKIDPTASVEMVTANHNITIHFL